ncbi:MAG: maltotransferase domain-containing protein, partial [Candidatus Rokuibacteriota bacterium]
MTKHRRPIAIEHVRPAVDDGRHPVKRVVGDTLTVTADIFKEGHDLLAASIRYRAADGADWSETALRPVDNDGWAGSFPLEANTRYRYTVSAWTDGYGSWVEEMRRRLAGGQTDLSSELLEGAEMLRGAQAGARGADATALARAIERFEAAPSRDARLDVLLDADLRQVMARAQPRPDLTLHDRELEVVVDRPEAAFAAWYELFPRSQARRPGRHGTFDDCIDRLPEIRRMGFDVAYLPPIHPIGRTARKGPDNALVAGPGDPGSPWAIGGPEGGHTAVHPDLGT